MSTTTTTLDECAALERKLEQAIQKRDRLIAEQEQKQREARRAWAEPIVDAWPSDLQAFAIAIDEARQHFTEAVGVGYADLLDAWDGLGRAIATLRGAHSRVTTALSWLGKRTFDDGSFANLPGAALEIPTFTDALNAAMADRMTGAANEVHAAFAAERAAVDEGT